MHCLLMKLSLSLSLSLCLVGDEEAGTGIRRCAI